MEETLECKVAITQYAAIVEILSRYGCRAIPTTSDELLRQILSICCYNLHDKPLAALRAIREGIPKPFWPGHSVGDLHDVYIATPHEPEELDMSEFSMV